MIDKPVRTFEDLDVWKYSIQFVKDIYKLTAKFPKEELYVLTSQLRRASVSVASNISEGSVKRSRLDYKRFIIMSLGSVAELKTQIIIAHEIGYIDFKVKEEFLTKLNLINKLLSGLERKLRSDT